MCPPPPLTPPPHLYTSQNRRTFAAVMTLDQYLLMSADTAADAPRAAAKHSPTHQPHATRAARYARRPKPEPTPSQAEADTEPTPTHQPHAMMGGGGCAAAAPNRWRNQLRTDSVPTPYQRRAQRTHTLSRHTHTQEYRTTGAEPGRIDF